MMHSNWWNHKWFKRGLFILAGFASMALVTQKGWAQAAAEPTVTEQLLTITQAIDTFWVLMAAFLVFFMQAGFAYVEGGFTRAKNQGNIIMKNVLDFSIGSVAFWAIGWTLMFSDGTPFFGTSGFFLSGADNSPLTGDDYAGVYSSINWAGVPLLAKFIFQLVFAATAATIVSGAMAERTKFKAYLIYSVFITALIYPIAGHWIWGGGWLASMGFWDFAGSTVVHSCGGWLALVGAIMLGPRIGKYGKDGKINAIPGHNIPMAALGVFILWMGWFGFNPGSTMGMAGAVSDVAYIAVTTNMSAACGVIGAMLAGWMMFKKPDVSMTLNGALAGLVAITAPCPWVAPWAAAVIGFLAGILVVVAVVAIEKARADDPVGAVAVHGVCGAFGTLSIGIFSKGGFGDAGPAAGLLYGGGAGQLAIQAIGVGAMFVWCIVTGVILFGAIKLIVGLRVTAEEEMEGLDIGEHGSSAYPYFPTFDTGAAPGTDMPHAPAPVLQPTATTRPVAEV